MSDDPKPPTAPCHRCGKPAEYEAIGGRLPWRFAALNWGSRLNAKLHRRWRPWHIECLTPTLEVYGPQVPIWVHIRKLRRFTARKYGREQ